MVDVEHRMVASRDQEGKRTDHGTGVHCKRRDPAWYSTVWQSEHSPKSPDLGVRKTNKRGVQRFQAGKNISNPRTALK